MKSLPKFLLETLTPKQRSWVDKRSGYSSPHDELFQNPPEGSRRVDRDTFAMPLEPVDKTIENQVRGHLEPHGYRIHDYVGGMATDKHGREVSIGKALGRVKQDPNMYASDPRVRARQSDAINGDTHEIVISRNPYHVAGMSTDRNWDSCMTLPGDSRNPGGGSYRHKMGADLRHGTLVAYLTKKGVAQPNKELEKHEALSRMLMKKFESVDGSPDIWRAERSSYSPPMGSSSRGSRRGAYPQFEGAVTNFAENRWKAPEGSIHFKNSELYNDDGVTSTGGDIKNYSSDQLESLRKHLSRQDQDLDYMKEPYDRAHDIHHHYIQIARHPNTSSKTLENLVPDPHDNLQDRYLGGGDAKSELLHHILKHPNTNIDTIRDIVENHGHDIDPDEAYEAEQRVVSHHSTSQDDLLHHARFSHLHDAILKNPNVDDDVLHEMYHNSDPDPHMMGRIASHPVKYDAHHDAMLDDIEDGKFNDNPDVRHALLKGIARSSKNHDHLDRVSKLSDHNDVQRLLTKNKHTNAGTLYHIGKNMGSDYPEQNTARIQKYHQGELHTYDPHTKNWTVKDYNPDTRETNDVPSHNQDHLNSIFSDEVSESNNLHDHYLRNKHRKILSNIIKHPNAALTHLHSLSKHDDPIISGLAKERISKFEQPRKISESSILTFKEFLLR